MGLIRVRRQNIAIMRYPFDRYVCVVRGEGMCSLKSEDSSGYKPARQLGPGVLKIILIKTHGWDVITISSKQWPPICLCPHTIHSSLPLLYLTPSRVIFRPLEHKTPLGSDAPTPFAIVVILQRSSAVLWLPMSSYANTTFQIHTFP